ncbi:MAG: hypothetical protein WHS87_03845 [Anaerolineales bacterium]
MKRLLVLIVLFVLAIGSLGADRQRTPHSWSNTQQIRGRSFTPTLLSDLNPSPAPLTSAALASLLPKMSGRPANALAKELGYTMLRGKKIEGLTSPITGMDNIESADGYYWENEPSMAVNPQNPSIVVVFSHYYNATSGGSCQAIVSYDGGVSFDWMHDYVYPPVPSGGDCFDPVVRFSPDGFYAYYIYMDVDSFGDTEIVLQRADGYNPTNLIGAPVTVFDHPSYFIDKPWVDVSYYDTANPGVVYVTATWFDGSSNSYITFNASADYGASWLYAPGNPLILAVGSSSINEVVSGSRPIGIRLSDGYLAVCWYWSGVDGWLSGTFFTECEAHNSYGGLFGSGSWSSFFYPGGVHKYELSYWLGPSIAYHRWWSGMYPSLAVDDQGMVYVAYAADPNTNQNDIEAGNVYLARFFIDTLAGSTLPPVLVGSGTTAQGYPTVAARFDFATGKFMVFVGYGDYLTGNAKYNIVYRKALRAPSGSGIFNLPFGGKVKVSDRPSSSDTSFIGDYIDSALTGRTYHIVWTDRSDVPIPYEDDDVLHDMFVP